MSTSYMKLFEDFLQRKESDMNRAAAAQSDDENDQPQSACSETIAGILGTGSNSSNGNNKMEHAYTRDNSRSAVVPTGLSQARTILVRPAPQCPSCLTHPLEEHDHDNINQASVPGYNEIAAKESMDECARIAKYVNNNNADSELWETRINQSGWSNMQKQLFSKVVRILDNDQLGRLASIGRQNEPMQRRVVVDKSAARMRKALASVAWDARLTQWLHGILMDSLPSTYMASYLDILQTLKTKLPTLMDKMLFGRPMNISQELLAPVMKQKWEPLAITKVRKLSHNAVIVVMPVMPTNGTIPDRLKTWYQYFSGLAEVVHVALPSTSGHILRQSLDELAEQIVSLTRVKIQSLRSEVPGRNIILVGFNGGAALALQVAISESVSCVVCMGFAYNTYNGVRGTPDDRILDIKIPILFVIGQNSARTSSEEIESLREKMQSDTSLVVVGSADDSLRVPRSRRKIENVTQSMVDIMVMDEVYEFTQKILTNPPGPRIPTWLGGHNKQARNQITAPGNVESCGTGKVTPNQRKRKQDFSNADPDSIPAKSKNIPSVGRPRTRPMPTTTKVAQIGASNTAKAPIPQQKPPTSPNSVSNEILNMAIQSILSDDETTFNTTNDTNTQKQVTNYEIVAPSKSSPIKTALIKPVQRQTIIGGSGNASTSIGTKIKMIPSNQFVQLKPPLQSQSKIYTIKTTSMLNQPTQQIGGASIGSIVTTSPSPAQQHQQQIFTLKSPNGQTTQFVTAAPSTAQQKFTVVKNAVAGTSLQLPSNKSAGMQADGSTGATDTPLDIIDMPFLFADSDGNITDEVTTAANDSHQIVGNISQTSNKSSTTSSVGKMIINPKFVKEISAAPAITTISKPTQKTVAGGGTYVIGKKNCSILHQPTQPNKPNKVVFINPNTMKPCPNIISRSTMPQQLTKYNKVVVTNPKTSATTLAQRRTTQIIPTQVGGGTPMVSTVKQMNLQAIKTPISIGARQSGILNVSTKSLPQVQIIGTANGGNILSSAGIPTTTTVVGTTAVTGGNNLDRTQIRNIVVKSGGLKQMLPHMKTQLLNPNLTVRKLVNIVGTPKSSVSNAAQECTGSNNASALQSAPKVITLNPINPSVSIVD